MGLSTSLLVAPAAADPTPTPAPVSPVPRPAATPDPVETAQREAKRQNKQVEIGALHTENSTTVANSNGKTLGTYVYSAPIRVKKDGAWAAIDTTLVEEGGAVRPKVSKVEVTLSAGGDTTLARSKTNKGEAAVSAPTALPKPELSGSTATYRSAYGPGIDLVVTVTPTGLRQEVVIPQRPVGKLDLRLPVKLPTGVKYGKDASGKPTLPTVDSDGKATPLTPALLLDKTAASPEAPPDAGRMSTVAATVEQTGKGPVLRYTPDEVFLADPATTYPVTLMMDSTPWYGAGMPVADTFINNGTWGTGAPNQYMDALVAGKTNDGAVWRSYVRYDLTNAPFYGLHVIDADLRPWNYITHACGAEVGEIAVRRITSSWTMSSLRWNNQPSVTTSGQGTKGSGVGRVNTNPPRYCSDPAQEVYYSIENIVRAWAGGEPNYGLQIGALNEGGPLNYREYLSAEWAGIDGRGPVLFVEYESPPQTVEVDTFQYGQFEATPENLAEMRSRQTDTEDQPFTNPTDEEARDAALNSSERVIVDARTLQSPSDLTEEEIGWEHEDEGPGYEESEDPPSSDPDTIAPSVFTNPAAGERDISVNTTIRAAFTEPVTGAVFALKNPSGADVAVTITSVGEPDQGWELAPGQPLQAGTVYRIEVRAARDAAGNVMANYTASFTTKGNGPTPTPSPTTCAEPAWNAAADYWYRAKVSHKGHLWQVAWEWAEPGDEPGVHEVWEDLGPCGGSTPNPTITPTPSPTPTPTRTLDPLCARSPAWSRGATYSTGTYVTHRDYVWEALKLGSWGSRGEPGVDSKGWISRGYCYSTSSGGLTAPSSQQKSRSETMAVMDDDSRVDECWRNKAVASDQARDGYLASRLNWCAIHDLYSGSAQFGTRTMVNGIQADVTIIGFTSPSGKDNTRERFSDFRISVKNVVPVGGTYTQKAYIAFGARVKGGSCKVVGDAYHQAKWQDWKAGKTAQFRILSDEAGGAGEDKIERCHPKFYSKVWLPDIPSTPVRYTWSNAKPQVRCDSASYITSTRGAGCVFDKAHPVYQTTETLPGDPWSAGGDPDNVNTSYRNVPGHIWTALNRAHLTFPQIPGKYIPGGVAAGPPLTRNVRKYWKKKNNTKVRALCRALFRDFDRKDPVLGKPAKIDGVEVPAADRRVYECDEYPFESTMQGAWTSVERIKGTPEHGRYSVRPVWWQNNGADGRQLGVFYRDSRILGIDGKKRDIITDQFSVEAIAPGRQP
ncbi:DNRLRE domain-containing protein [Streptosporangium sp. NPDC023825]|uniref:DNRLRE domain-containing protein n=1 Tax=Streptosporangium sp. NPDC023825 TaxID=3154909 RepID=UPI0034305E7B